MIELKNYLSLILNDINEARFKSDLKSMDLAKTYEKDDFLKKIPVPRVRLQSVDLSIPVLINSAEFDDKPPKYQLKYTSTFATRVYSIIRHNYLNIYNKKFNRNESLAIRELAKKAHTELPNNASKNELNEQLAKYSNNVANNVAKSLSQTIDPDNSFIDKVSKDLRDFSRNSIHKINQKKELIVSVDSANLNENGSEQSITRINIKLFEEGLDIVDSTDLDGNLKSTIVVE